jgi:hypothetical protein
MEHGTSAGLRVAHRRGARGPPRPPLVHRRARPAQVGRHLPRRARDAFDRGHALRRLGHRRVQPGPGERRARQARPEQLRAAAVGHARTAPPARMFCDIENLDGTPSRATPARCSSATSTKARERGFSFLVAPEMEFFYFADGDPSKAPEPLDTGSTSTSPPPTWPATSASARSTCSRRWASPSSTRSTRTPRASTRSTCATPTPCRWPTT